MLKPTCTLTLALLIAGVLVAGNRAIGAAPPDSQPALKETKLVTATKRVRIISVDLKNKTFVAVKALADPPKYEIPCQFSDETKFLLGKNGEATTAEKLIFEGSLLHLNFSKDAKGPKDQLRKVNYAFPYAPKKK